MTESPDEVAHAMASDICDVVEALDARIFPGKLAEVSYNELLGEGAEHIPENAIAFTYYQKYNEETKGHERTPIYIIRSKYMPGRMTDLIMYSSRLVDGEVVLTDYNLEEHKFALAAHEVSHRCQRELDRFTPITPENIDLLPQIKPRANFCLSRNMGMRPNEFDALMIEDAVLMVLHSQDEFNEGLFEKVISATTARSPQDLYTFLKSLGI